MKLSPMLRGALFYALYWGVVGFFDPYPNVYYAQIGLNGRQIGIIGALFPLSALLFSPIVSNLADRRGWRVRLLAATCLFFGLVVYLLGLPTTFTGILTISIFVAMARTPIAPLGDSLISRMASREQLNFGAMRMWGSLTFAVLASLSGFLWDQFGLKTMFPVTGLLFLLVAASALTLTEERGPQSISHQPMRLIRQDPLLASLIISSMLMGASNIMGYVFSSVYMAELGGGMQMIGMFFGLPAFFEIPTLLFGTRLMRRWGDVRTIMVSFILLGTGLVGFALTTQPWVMILFGMVRGVAWGLYFISIVTIINKRTPSEMASTFLAILNAASMGIAPLIASPLAGVIYDLVGPIYVFITGACLCAAAVAVLMIGEKISNKTLHSLAQD